MDKLIAPKCTTFKLSACWFVPSEPIPPAAFVATGLPQHFDYGLESPGQLWQGVVQARQLDFRKHARVSVDLLPCRVEPISFLTVFAPMKASRILMPLHRVFVKKSKILCQV